MPRSIISTGCSGAVGQSLTKLFAENGYYVVGLDIRPFDGECPTAFEFIELDLDTLCADPSGLSYLREKLEQLGVLQNLFGLVNNAALQILKPALELEQKELYKSFNINVVAAFLLSKFCFGYLSANAGSIVNISSIHAKLSKKNFLAYSTTKSAMTALTRACAIEWSNSVRVNAIEPAAVETDLLRSSFEDPEKALIELRECHPSGRIGDKDQLASHVKYLIETSDPQLSGCILTVDGAISGLLNDV